MSNKPKIISSENQLKIADLFVLLVAVFTLSLAPILIRLSENEISPNATIFNRYWIATVVLGLWYGFKTIGFRDASNFSKLEETYTIRDIVTFLVLAMSSLACLTSWAWSLTQTSVANSNLLHNMTPIFATVGGWLFLNHHFNGRFIWGMTLALTGTGIIGITDWQIADDRFLGDALALLSAFFSGVGYLIIEDLRKKFSAITILLWSSFLRTLLILPVIPIDKDHIFPISWLGWLAVISLGILCQAIGNGILVYSLKKFSSGFISLFILLDPVIAAILSAVIFAESLSLSNWLAFVVILTGIYIAKSGGDAEKSNHSSLKIENYSSTTTNE